MIAPCTIANHFGGINISETTVDPPELIGSRLVIKCRRLSLSREHPLSIEQHISELIDVAVYPDFPLLGQPGVEVLGSLNCSFVFDDPTFSRRIIAPYVKNLENGSVAWLPEREYTDVKRDRSDEQLNSYDLSDSALTEPSAYVRHWDIVASGFYLVVRRK